MNTLPKMKQKYYESILEIAFYYIASPLNIVTTTLQ